MSTYCQFLSSHWLTQSSPWKKQVLMYLQPEHTIDLATEKLLTHGGNSMCCLLLHSECSFCWITLSLWPTTTVVSAKLRFHTLIITLSHIIEKTQLKGVNLYFIYSSVLKLSSTSSIISDNRETSDWSQIHSSAGQWAQIHRVKESTETRIRCPGTD